ncbi:MAG: WecB/TagA/CpsF family glycosyltransferase [Acidobacteriota bacterium]
MTAWHLKSSDFLGLKLSRLDLGAVLTSVDVAVAEQRPLYHCVLNASKVVAAARDVELRQLLNSFDLINADGQSVVWAARLLGMGQFERITGIDLMQTLLARASARHYSVYFLGATEAVLRSMIDNMARRHPALRIAGSHHGYFQAEDEPSLCDRINGSDADLLFVGTPSPMKERFLIHNRTRLTVPFAMGVGGTFDVLAGTIQRAPRFLQETGLEWAFRLAQEPRRLWKRYLYSNSRFVWLVARKRLQRGILSATADV